MPLFLWNNRYRFFILSSNLVLDCKKARGSCVKPWSLLVETSSSGGMERAKGIEPSSQPWEGHILPLNHTRLRGFAASTRQARANYLNLYQTTPTIATALPSSDGFEAANGLAQSG